MTPPRTTFNPGVTRRDLLGWAMYDFANSGYATVVLTAVFSAYFVGVVAANADWATLAWTLSLSLSHALVMISLPSISAWADRHAAKKRALLISTLGCVVCTAGLASVGAGDVVWAGVLIALSNCFLPMVNLWRPRFCLNWLRPKPWAASALGVGPGAMWAVCSLWAFDWPMCFGRKPKAKRRASLCPSPC